MSVSERVQKVLAAAGVGSRREIERLIDAGKVSMNGKPVRLGDKAEPGDRLQVDGRWVQIPQAQCPKRVIAYHKPVGEIGTRQDPEGRPTVFDRLPKVKGGRWVAVGRLDINSCGLILFTTDGELAHALMHPSREVPREYAVRVLGQVSPEHMSRLRQGIRLEDGMAKFETIRENGGEGANRWYRVSLKEGRNREVRRLWEAAGFTVSRLMRVGFGPIALPRDLHRGQARDLSPVQLGALYEIAGLKPPVTTTRARETPRSRQRR